MTKCDFCTKSSPDGRCAYDIFTENKDSRRKSSPKEEECKKAIDLMRDTILKGNAVFNI